MHDYFYSPHKQINSYMMFDVLYFETNTTSLDPLDPQEANIQKPVRLSRTEVDQICVQDADIQYCFDLLDGKQTQSPEMIDYRNEYNQSLKF